MATEVPTAVIVCPDCRGKGEIGGKRCPFCEGWGERIGPRILQVLTRDDYDRVRADEAREEQARWDEAQTEALELAAERFNDHTEDVP